MFIALGVVFVAGCATKTDVSAAPKPVVRQIVVVPVESPPQTYSQNRNLASGILFPVWIQWLDNRWKTEQFAAQMNDSLLKLGSAMTADLVEHLEREGYVASVLTEVPRYPDYPDEIDYSKIKTDAAVLHVWFEDVSMYSGAGSIHYVPRVNVSAYLIYPSADEPIYFETIYYGADSRNESTYWGMPAHEDYKYKTFEAMASRPGHVSEGFRVGVRTVAKHLAQEFRRLFDGPATQTQ